MKEQIEIGDVYLTTNGDARLVTHALVEPRGLAVLRKDGSVTNITCLDYTGAGISREFLFNIKDVLTMVSR